VSGNLASESITVEFTVPIPSPQYYGGSGLTLGTGKLYLRIDSALTQGIDRAALQAGSAASENGTAVTSIDILHTSIRFNFNQPTQSNDRFVIVFKLVTLDDEESGSYTVSFDVP
jgi:hypothetical protein